jgi:hypothetical protein
VANVENPNVTVVPHPRKDVNRLQVVLLNVAVDAVKYVDVVIEDVLDVVI